MEFGIEKCAMLVLKRGQVATSNGIKLPDESVIKSVKDGESYKYLGMLQADQIKHQEMKDKVMKEYKRRVRKILETKLNAGNLIKGINTWAVSLLSYSAAFLDWTKFEMEHGQFLRQTDDITGEDRWLWLKQGNLKREIDAAQEQAVRTNVIKAKIDNTQEQSKCRMCREKDETVNHLISECSKMAQREYKRRHDWVGRRVHWDVCRKYGIEVKDKWYQQEPGSVIENKKCKILWDFTVQTDHIIQARRPDMIVIDKETNKAQVSHPIPLLSHMTAGWTVKRWRRLRSTKISYEN